MIRFIIKRYKEIGIKAKELKDYDNVAKNISADISNNDDLYNKVCQKEGMLSDKGLCEYVTDVLYSRDPEKLLSCKV